MKKTELPNCPKWLLDAHTENENVEWDCSERRYIVWRGGDWRGGIWRGGYWHGGIWRGGIWHGGIWRGGDWHGGVWRGGIWRDGIWRGGIWRGGIWRGRETRSYLRVVSLASGYAPSFWFFPDGEPHVSAGCFSGTLSDFQSQVRAHHANNAQALAEYEAVFALVATRESVGG